MRTKILLTAVAVAALTVAIPLELLAQRGGGGGRGGGVSVGGGRGGVSVGGARAGVAVGGARVGVATGRTGVAVTPGRAGVAVGVGRPGVAVGTARYGYGYRYPGWRYGRYGWYGSPWRYGRYGWYGYPRYAYGYGGNYYSSGSYAPASAVYDYPMEQPYAGDGVAIRNQTEATLSFLLDDARRLTIQPGETIRLTERGQFTVSFDRGSGLGSARYTVSEGLYAFTPTGEGRELFRQPADQPIASAAADAGLPRTAERPRLDELPLDNRVDEGRIRDELPPRPDDGN